MFYIKDGYALINKIIAFLGDIIEKGCPGNLPRFASLGYQSFAMHYRNLNTVIQSFTFEIRRCFSINKFYDCMQNIGYILELRQNRMQYANYCDMALSLVLHFINRIPTQIIDLKFARSESKNNPLIYILFIIVQFGFTDDLKTKQILISMITTILKCSTKTFTPAQTAKLEEIINKNNVLLTSKNHWLIYDFARFLLYDFLLLEEQAFIKIIFNNVLATTYTEDNVEYILRSRSFLVSMMLYEMKVFKRKLNLAPYLLVLEPQKKQFLSVIEQKLDRILYQVIHIYFYNKTSAPLPDEMLVPFTVKTAYDLDETPWAKIGNEPRLWQSPHLSSVTQALINQPILTFIAEGLVRDVILNYAGQAWSLHRENMKRNRGSCTIL